MDVTALGGPEALAELKPEWDALFERSARRRPFFTHAWLDASWRHYPEGDRLLTVCIRDAGRLVGAVGLRAKRSLGMERLLFAVSQADCCDVLMESGAEWEVLGALVGWLKDERPGWDLVRLRGICRESPTGCRLPVVAAEAGLAACALRAETAPSIALPGTWEDFLAGAPGRTRLRRHLQMRRRLEHDCGELVLQAICGADLTGDAFARFLALHRRGWESRGGSGVIPDERAARFHGDIVAALAPTGMPLILRLVAGEREVAAYYGFVTDGVLLAYIPGFEPDLAPYSPGGQLMISLVRYGIEQGWREIDLMRGAERYKFDYTHRCSYSMDHTLARSARRLRLFGASVGLRSLVGR